MFINSLVSREPHRRLRKAQVLAMVGLPARNMVTIPGTSVALALVAMVQWLFAALVRQGFISSSMGTLVRVVKPFTTLHKSPFHSTLLIKP